MPYYYKQLWSSESYVGPTPTSVSASTSGWGLGWYWSFWWAHTSRRWCVASINCGCAPLVCVTRVEKLVAHHYCSSIFCFIHVVPNPLLLSSSNILAQLRIWIWYVHNIFFGVLSKRTLHEVTLNCFVPNVLHSLLVVVPWHVPMEAELLQFIAYGDHMWAGDV
jgi:hypothetical protein